MAEWWEWWIIHWLVSKIINTFQGITKSILVIDAFFSGWIIRNYHQPNICIIDILPKSSQQSRLLNFKRKVLERPPYVECWGFLLFQSIGGFPNHPVTMTITSYVLRTMVTLGFENPTKYPQVSWIFMVYPQHIPTLMALNSYKWDYNSYN